MSMSLCAGRTSLSVNGKAAALLDNMVRFGGGCDSVCRYNLAQEHGDLINLQDWYQSFKSTVLSTNKLKSPLQHSPMSKKVKSSPSESEASIQYPMLLLM
ncbi:hypothetical protein GW17_00019541 [Ensete ventricosum]|nr:hypothetical protein GW17_00019541 [Ensete ventricosum]